VTARKARVSLCMIVRNEAHNLADCLTTVAHLFDEIVIVDTGSDDETKEIARQFTAHVHDFPWCDDFAAARNESLRHATGDWIFWLDADDRVSPEQATALAELFASLDDAPRVFLMNTVLCPASSAKDRFLVSHSRLFRRDARLRWQGRVHEQLRPEPITLGYQWIFTDIEIDHIGYQDRVHADRKARRKLRLLRMDYAVNPDDPSTLLHLAMALSGVGAFRESRQALLKLLEVSEPGHPCLRRVYSGLSELAANDAKPAEALEFAERGLREFPGDVYLLFAKASAFYALENYPAATQTLQQLMATGHHRTLLIGAPGDLQTKLAPRMLGAVRRLQGAYEEAQSIFHNVLARYPQDVSTWYNLGLVYLDQSDGAKLMLVTRQLLALPDGKVDAYMLTSLWHLRHGNLVAAGAIIDQFVAEAPRDPLPRMLRAEWLSRSGAPWTDQVRALRDLLRIQPSNLEAQKWLAKIEACGLEVAPTASASAVTFSPPAATAQLVA
jgi:tetratricopeptide (TPR) repeat protein